MRRIASTTKVVLAAILVLVGLGASPALAQDHGAEGLGVQLIGGPLFANFADTEDFDTENKTGFLVGLGLGGNRGGRVGVEADILYGQKGAEIVGVGDFAHHVVHVPVMLKVNAGSGNANGPSVFGVAGGFFDWQFSSKLNDVDISEDTDGFEVGYVLGGGVEVLRFSVQLRFIRGLREIDRTFDLGSSSESKSQAVAVLFGFRVN